MSNCKDSDASLKCSIYDDKKNCQQCVIGYVLTILAEQDWYCMEIEVTGDCDIFEVTEDN